ncbi:hypothetical protein [Oleiagrimonas sp. C23AA]|uniref:hypothetical protein n=1 Tax=Oleiagrimonas sp. C23AA TaxID=2719047 RepID=UPI001422A8E8|nr:hypothetical protein [Oleiagrimonas sp. C23AA]NII11200.1 hypothetical protein [Oleiagrimonas sp. C23AA]
MAAPSGIQAAAGTSANSAAVSQQTQETFHKNMQVMRGQMMQLRTTSDPAARAKLLNAHMQTMQSTMHMMMGQRGMRGSGGMGPGMMRGSGMGRAGGMMGGNGQMMQMMMAQMLQHQQAMQAMGCTK